MPLAQAYMARGAADFPRAEAVLRSVIEGNPLLTPEADEYRQALFELGHGCTTAPIGTSRRSPGSIDWTTPGTPVTTVWGRRCS